MEQALSGLHWKTLLIYLDDIIVFSPDSQTHISRLREEFERLRGAGLKLKPSKCALLQPSAAMTWRPILKRYGLWKTWLPPRILQGSGLSWDW